ncbi:hypothetical protein GALMADRAFT_1061215 [Galerina marginata CBS 339.88]|uniref:Uncharacterized protein n=1 Tax=Galerina marginata (strain CBS 339.88) TaxID=685588 RepID=A0A067SLW1_GALM3|nr:hypothetical protein GALMADRAFT_1061215 [Galerina marginata CBS 339.88]
MSQIISSETLDFQYRIPAGPQALRVRYAMEEFLFPQQTRPHVEGWLSVRLRYLCGYNGLKRQASGEYILTMFTFVAQDSDEKTTSIFGLLPGDPFVGDRPSASRVVSILCFLDVRPWRWSMTDAAHEQSPAMSCCWRLLTASRPTTTHGERRSTISADTHVFFYFWRLLGTPPWCDTLRSLENKTRTAPRLKAKGAIYHSCKLG